MVAVIFCNGHDRVKHVGYSAIPDQYLELIHMDRWWMVCQLVVKVGVRQVMVSHILKYILKIHRIT